MASNNITELCEIAYKYGTDKCPQIKHCYTPYYYGMFKDRRSEVKKVLELGIGRFRASLKMWRDFFPNAMIYGADIRPETLFTDNRIETFLCDERKSKDLEKLLLSTGSDIDIFIDDASHKVKDQIFTCLTVLPLLKKGATYIIEDVGHSRDISKAVACLKGFTSFVQDVPRTWPGGMLYVINN